MTQSTVQSSDERTIAAPRSIVQPRSQRFGSLGGAYRGATRFMRRQPIGAVSAIVLALLVVVAVIGPSLMRYEPAEMVPGQRLQSPSIDHPFGTDERARDIFSRTVSGARVSLQVAFIAVGIGVLGGAILGLTTGYLGGWFDVVVQRLMDALLAFPGLVLALTFAALLGAGIVNVMVAIGIVIIPNVNRIVRGQTLSVSQNQYIEAARALGASEMRIILRHVAINVIAPIIIIASIVMGYAILVEASLSFLGVGLDPTQPSWGQMLSLGRSQMELAPWLVLAPGLAITLVVLAFNLFGDALRDELDPSLRGSR